MRKIAGVGLCILFAVSVVFFLSANVNAAEKTLTVEKIVTATSVENREPVGDKTEFEAAVGKVSCWTKVVAKTTPATIKHVWYLGDKKVFEQALELKNPTSRTWSTKAVKAGKWKVEVTDEGGAVLSSVEFTVK
jgi:hypothetical protein